MRTTTHRDTTANRWSRPSVEDSLQHRRREQRSKPTLITCAEREDGVTERARHGTMRRKTIKREARVSPSTQLAPFSSRVREIQPPEVSTVAIEQCLHGSDFNDEDLGGEEGNSYGERRTQERRPQEDASSFSTAHNGPSDIMGISAAHAQR